MGIFFRAHCPQCWDIMHGGKCDGCGYEEPPPPPSPPYVPSALEIRRAIEWGAIAERFGLELGAAMGRNWDGVLQP